MGIERQGDEPPDAGAGHLRQGRRGKGMPVAHAGPHPEAAVLVQCSLQGPTLAVGDPADRGAAADEPVSLAGLRRPAAGYPPGNEFLEERRAQRDDLPVRKKVEEKGLDIGKGIGTAQVQQQDACGFVISHGGNVHAASVRRQENELLLLIWPLPVTIIKV